MISHKDAQKAQKSADLYEHALQNFRKTMMAESRAPDRETRPAKSIFGGCHEFKELNTLARFSSSYRDAVDHVDDHSDH
jgi:hypothetical protein